MTEAYRSIIGTGALSRLGEVLESLAATRILLVTGRRSFTASGASERIADAMHGKDVLHVSTSGGLLTEARFRRWWVEASQRGTPDVVLGIGGGRTLDTAKLLAGFVHSAQNASEPRLDASCIQEVPPLVAVPTTAGSGSEATHFAVLYVEGRKRSIAHPDLQPDFAIVDPELTYGLDPKTTAISGLDALSQGIESLWSVQSSPESREYAAQAVGLVWPNLLRAATDPDSNSRLSMAKGAHFAGCAINTSFTTAPHALSYPMTHDFGVPHGHAVALTLGPTLLYNYGVDDTDVTHPSGIQHVRSSVLQVSALLGAGSAARAAALLETMLEELGLETRLSQLGITASEDHESIAAGVDPRRLRNNPRRLTPDSVRELLAAIA